MNPTFYCSKFEFMFVEKFSFSYLFGKYVEKFLKWNLGISENFFKVKLGIIFV